jgi:hypothetical protein
VRRREADFFRCLHDDIPLPVAQCEKRITLVAAISMEGSLTGQMIVIPRKRIEINHFPGRLMGPELIDPFSIKTSHQPGNT